MLFAKCVSEGFHMWDCSTAAAFSDVRGQSGGCAVPAMRIFSQCDTKHMGIPALLLFTSLSQSSLKVTDEVMHALNRTMLFPN